MPAEHLKQGGARPPVLSFESARPSSFCGLLTDARARPITLSSCEMRSFESGETSRRTTREEGNMSNHPFASHRPRGYFVGAALLGGVGLVIGLGLSAALGFRGSWTGERSSTPLVR